MRKKELLAYLDEAFIELKDSIERFIEECEVNYEGTKDYKEELEKINQAKEEIISIITKS